MQNLISHSKNSRATDNSSQNIFTLEERPRISSIWFYLVSQTLIWVGIATIVFTLALLF